MNIIGTIILVTLAADFVLNVIAEVLNLRCQSNELPEGFRGVYSPERYRQSQVYLKTRTRFGWVTATFDLALLLLFWFGGGFELLDNLVRQWGYSPVITGTLYIGILLAARALLGQPFAIYSTFVIEARFGFNTATTTTFMADRMKGLLLAVVIGGPALAGVLAFFEYTGADAWWQCWLAATVFIFGLQYLAPTWIMPLFNKFEPLEEGELKTAILGLAGTVDYPLTNVLVMDGSRRSKKSNAFFTGFGRNKRIALFDTLIQQHTPAEIIAVLAHEIGHFKRHHIKQMMAASILQLGGMLFLLSLFISYQGLFDAFYMERPSVYAGMLFFGLLFAPLDFFVALGMHSLSRRNEYEADRFAVSATGNPVAMVTALKKLASDNLTNLTPHPLYVFLNYSHPPMPARVRAILNYSLVDQKGSRGRSREV
ncbi:MAG: M48 family metallopeptidase [Desulfobacterales bacterium]|nr:M48 family metallopeptidase [Desulfobacterales bacterium]